MRVIALSLLLISNTAFAKKCIFELKKDSLQVEWIAFKTPKKIGVKGTFEKLGVKNFTKTQSFGNMLKGLTFNIDTNSINTSDPARDKKIYSNFFKTMNSGDKISGRVLNYKRKVLTLAVKMNGKEIEVPLLMDKEKLIFTATGHIDILDFAMGGNLAAINKACSELHEGKTWSDVTVTLRGNYLESCK